MSLSNTVSDGIIKYLEKAGKTQSDLARYLNVSRSTVNKWITKERVPQMGNIDKICAFFGVSRDEFLGSDNEYAQTARLIACRETLRELIATALDASDDDIQTITAMLKILKDKH